MRCWCYLEVTQGNLERASLHLTKKSQEVSETGKHSLEVLFIEHIHQMSIMESYEENVESVFALDINNQRIK